MQEQDSPTKKTSFSLADSELKQINPKWFRGPTAGH
jgi:hypothetical protein